MAEEKISPSVRTTEQYEADKAAGINRQAQAFDGITDQELTKPTVRPKDEPLDDTIPNILNVAGVRGLHRAAQIIFEKYYTDWVSQRFIRDNTVVQAHQAKTPIMAGDYWQPEYAARMKMETARALVISLKEEIDGS